MRGKIYVGVAEIDPWLQPGETDRLKAALDAAGTSYSLEVYPGVQHGFAANGTPMQTAMLRSVTGSVFWPYFKKRYRKYSHKYIRCSSPLQKRRGRHRGRGGASFGDYNFAAGSTNSRASFSNRWTIVRSSCGASRQTSSTSICAGIAIAFRSSMVIGRT